MNRFLPLEKRSKRAQRQAYAARRGSWNGVNPVSKVIPSGKAYRRCKNRIDWDGEPPRSSRHEELGGSRFSLQEQPLSSIAVDCLIPYVLSINSLSEFPKSILQLSAIFQQAE